MGLFGPSKKFSQMLTPEQQYFASGTHQHTEEDTRRQSEARTSRYRRQQQQETERAETETRRQQVTRAGTLRRRGRTVILEGGWQFATDKLPKGDLGGMSFQGDRLGDLTVKDLHALAENHGPNCRCGLG
ncbi:hypothetical protein [Streptomyces vietnamensis]|uniref:Uncharacterized protein n=1 Tax=Streptomyces vietnamensis TaxID=362257 RepID=A0A0B5I8U4_9ACTN|nr:hypothetical protein [Streptomyces vietnamensis]AJF70445.1 hypothetical protein SVTN_40475 [Streptomyces vietnamensis]